MLDSLDESFDVGRDAGVPVVISHHKTTGVANFGRTHADPAEDRGGDAGQEVGLDVYPYIASSTVLGRAAHRGAEGADHVVQVSAGVRGPGACRDRRRMGRRAREAAERLQPAGAIYFMMDEADVQRVLAFRTRWSGRTGCRMTATRTRGFGARSRASSAITAASSASSISKPRCAR